MKISVTRGGGFAGLTEVVATVDTAKLPPAVSQELQRMLQEAGVFSSAPEQSETPIGADMFRYELTIVDDAEHRTATLVDDGSPATAKSQRLIARLIELRN